MNDRANIIQQYAKADVSARVELLIKYYLTFPHLIKGYEQSLSFIIKEEKTYMRKQGRGDLGLRVQTSGTSDITANAAIENVMIMEAIQKGNLEDVASELESRILMKYQSEIKILQDMKEDYQVLKSAFFYLDPDACEIFEKYLRCGRHTEKLAYELDIKPETLKMQMYRTKKVLMEQTGSILNRKYQYK